MSIFWIDSFCLLFSYQEEKVNLLVILDKRTVEYYNNNMPPQTTKQLGNKAEDVASNWLVKNGFDILARNWQVHGECEIDIVAIKNDVLFFVEVKFRKMIYTATG